MKTKSQIIPKWTIYCLTFFVSLNWLAAGPNYEPPQELVGSWKGSARIGMIWCDQKNLIIELTIKENGTVAGKAGDAKLVQGRIKKNRSWFGRKIKVKTDYIVVAELVGPLVKSEGIHRKQLKLPFNLMKGAIQGGAHSSGRKFGGKKHGILSAGNMVLKPVPRTPH